MAKIAPAVMENANAVKELDEEENTTIFGLIGGAEGGGVGTGDQQLDIPIFKTEEGRYLATELGDPLIKGLTEVAKQRPENPIIFLANFLLNYAKGQDDGGGAGPGPGPGADPVENENVAVPKKRTTQLGAPVMPSGAARAVKGTDVNRPASPESLPSPEGHEDTNPNYDRDEHGQSMLHFAAARTHGRNALIQLIEESGGNIAYRDELYRTPRDVAIQAGQPANAKEIDRYVMSLAARGDLDSFQNLFNDGYDHVLNITDPENNTVIAVCKARGHGMLLDFLEGLQELEQRREDLHRSIRAGDMEELKALLNSPDGSRLAKAKNYYGRTSIHIAILREHEDMVDYLGRNFRQTLKIGDNLERTPLHYAMGVNGVEAISRILVKNGAKRVAKDLKGRQPSYYFMNKSDILRLQEEEDK